MEYADGSWYEGDFADDLEEGKGVREYADGSRYEGEFSHGKRHGKGTADPC